VLGSFRESRNNGNALVSLSTRMVVREPTCCRPWREKKVGSRTFFTLLILVLAVSVTITYKRTKSHKAVHFIFFSLVPKWFPFILVFTFTCHFQERGRLLVLCSNRGYDQVVILGSDRNWIVWHPALVEMGFKRERVSDVGWKAKAIVKKLS
jgi:hypothetical protein